MMSISHNEFEYQFLIYLLWDDAHNTKNNISLQWTTPLGKKIFFLFQVLVTFYELQKNLGASFSCTLKQIEQDLHQFILEI
jgi:predicted nucleic acid-binding protein